MPLKELDKNFLQEAIESRRRMLHIMNYDVSKTKTENILSEQGSPSWAKDLIDLPNKMLGLGGYDAKDFWRNQWVIPPTPWSDAVTLGQTINWVKTWDKHDWLAFGELTAIAISMFTPVGWVGLAANITALAFGTANAVEYWNEGNKYMAGLTAIFSLIPGWALAKQFKSIAKYGAEASFEAIRAAQAGTATKSQIAMAKEVSNELGKNAAILNEMYTEWLVKKYIQSILQSTAKTMAATLTLAKKAGIVIGAGGLLLGGVTYGWDKVYVALTHDEEGLEQKSPLRALIRLIKNNPKEVERQTKEGINQLGLELQKNSQKMDSVNLTTGKNVLDSIYNTWSVTKK